MREKSSDRPTLLYAAPNSPVDVQKPANSPVSVQEPIILTPVLLNKLKVMTGYSVVSPVTSVVSLFETSVSVVSSSQTASVVSSTQTIESVVSSSQTIASVVSSSQTIASVVSSTQTIASVVSSTRTIASVVSGQDEPALTMPVINLQPKANIQSGKSRTIPISEDIPAVDANIKESQSKVSSSSSIMEVGFLTNTTSTYSTTGHIPIILDTYVSINKVTAAEKKYSGCNEQINVVDNILDFNLQRLCGNSSAAVQFPTRSSSPSPTAAASHTPSKVVTLSSLRGNLQLQQPQILHSQTNVRCSESVKVANQKLQIST